VLRRSTRQPDKQTNQAAAEPPVRKAKRGFTLIEILIVVAVIAALARIAMPMYDRYVIKAKLMEAFSTLLELRVKQEQYWVDNHNYGPSACAVGALPASGKYFNFVCDISGSQQAYLLTATGQGDTFKNYKFTIDQNGQRKTTDFPGLSGLPYPCWISTPGPC
jgi:type IV pilus assembly protein PilE